VFVAKVLPKLLLKVVPVSYNICAIFDVVEHAVAPFESTRFEERQCEANLGFSIRVQLGLGHENVDAGVDKALCILW